MKIIITVLWVGFFGLSAHADVQNAVDVQTVREELARNHAQWQAKESWLTQLSLPELQRMMGLQQLPKGQLDFEGIHSLNEGALTEVDWRNYNGINWLGPVMNQGNCGSCVAFASVATLEAQASISYGTPWLHPSYSSQALFSCGGGGCDYGWRPDDAAQFLQSSGIPDEACLPYTAGSTGEDVSCNLCSDASSRTTRIVGYSTPSSMGGNVDAVKQALKKGPLMTTLMVYMDFVTYGGGVYKHVTGKIVGGHAVSLVGYSDSKRAWLIRNSWGHEWGDHGFGWISWDDPSGVGSDTWGFDLAPNETFLSVTSPGDREFVSGQYKLSVEGKGAMGSGIQFRLSDSEGHEVTRVACSEQKEQTCTAVLDTLQLKEGRYEIYAENSGSPAMKSQVREFYVINSEPKMSLSFTAADGTNLAGPVSGRPTFKVKALSTPVPIQHLEFRALDQNNKIAAIKTNDYVLENMKVGWRTITVPSGKYTILFHGETNYQGKTYTVDSNSMTITVKN